MLTFDPALNLTKLIKPSDEIYRDGDLCGKQIRHDWALTELDKANYSQVMMKGAEGETEMYS